MRKIILVKKCIITFKLSKFSVLKWYISLNFQWILTIWVPKFKLRCFLIKIKEILTKAFCPIDDLTTDTLFWAPGLMESSFDTLNFRILKKDKNLPTLQ